MSDVLQKEIKTLLRRLRPSLKMSPEQKDSTHIVKDFRDWLTIEDAFLSVVKETGVMSFDTESSLDRQNEIQLVVVGNLDAVAVIFDLRCLGQGRSVCEALPSTIIEVLTCQRIIKVGSDIASDLLEVCPLEDCGRWLDTQYLAQKASALELFGDFHNCWGLGRASYLLYKWDYKPTQYGKYVQHYGAPPPEGFQFLRDYRKMYRWHRSLAWYQITYLRSDALVPLAFVLRLMQALLVANPTFRCSALSPKVFLYVFGLETYMFPVRKFKDAYFWPFRSLQQLPPPPATEEECNVIAQEIWEELFAQVVVGVAEEAVEDALWAVEEKEDEIAIAEPRKLNEDLDELIIALEKDEQDEIEHDGELASKKRRTSVRPREEEESEGAGNMTINVEVMCADLEDPQPSTSSGAAANPGNAPRSSILGGTKPRKRKIPLQTALARLPPRHELEEGEVVESLSGRLQRGKRDVNIHRKQPVLPVCLHCAGEDHVRADCKEKKILPCFYPLCTVRDPHVIKCCRALHNVCKDCLVRGHYPEKCNVNKIASRDVFERYADFGLLTTQREVGLYNGAHFFHPKFAKRPPHTLDKDYADLLAMSCEAVSAWIMSIM